MVVVVLGGVDVAVVWLDVPFISVGAVVAGVAVPHEASTVTRATREHISNQVIFFTLGNSSSSFFSLLSAIACNNAYVRKLLQKMLTHKLLLCQAKNQANHGYYGRKKLTTRRTIFILVCMEPEDENHISRRYE